MGDWGLGDASKLSTLYSDTATSKPFQWTCLQDNIKSSWTEVITVTPFDASGIIITLFRPYTTAVGDCLVDIGVGENPDETAIISNLLLSYSTTISGYSYFIPISIPKGTRISVRGQVSDTAFDRDVDVCIVLLSGSFQHPQALSIVDTYGAVTADSGGTSIDPGGSANTKGSYSQIAASTTRAMRGMILAFGNQANVARTDTSILVDVSVGAEGSEQIILSDFALYANPAELLYPSTSPLIPVYIPTGSRLAARAQCSITDATDRLFDLIIYGVS